MLNMDLGLIKVNTSINIQRTDGRVHAASISSIDKELQVVTVEWLERDETKGKEIDLSDVIKLNPNLFPTSDSSKSKPQTSVESSVPGSRDTVKGIKRPTSTATSAPSNNQAPSRPSKVTSLSKDTEPQELVTKGSTQHQTIHNSSLSPSETMDENGDDKKNNFRRKSNCVKEVEKIKQKRNERRAQQIAIKEQNEADYDTSNPNWEFESMIWEFQKSLEYRPLTEEDPVKCQQICVCLRKRPLNKKEIYRREVDVITVPTKDMVYVHEPKAKVDLTKYLENQPFRFDYSFDEKSTNELIYKYTAQPLVECTFSGGMATCFAYGQTGSGKTHTMGGNFTGVKGKQDCSKGIYVLAASDVFQLLSSKYKNLDLSVGASFFEIYSGKVFDLLNGKQKLRVLEDGKQQVQVVGLKEEEIHSAEEVLKLIQHGNSVRTSGQTSANNHSSRSHAVFQIILRKRQNKKLHGKFSLIDLAGNERGADTMNSERQTRMEGAEINKSLLALKECIRALGRKGAHLPFRASKLTQVLRDSFIGENSRTCMIAMISPGMSCCEHTLNTLRYADRVKELEAGSTVEGSKYDQVSPGNQPVFNQLPSNKQNSDLVLLRNSSGDELSEDLLQFHETMDMMQQMEEAVVDDHKELTNKLITWMEEDVRLLKMTDEVDYDLESYAAQLYKLTCEKIESFNCLKEKVGKLCEELTMEDQLCKNIHSKK